MNKRSKYVNCERSEAKHLSDSVYEANRYETFVHTSSIRVEYYRSFEYCLKWERPMFRRRSSRLPKISKKSPERSPSPNEEVIQRRLKGKRHRTGLKKAEASDSVVNTDDGRVRDILDIINSTHDAKLVAEEDEVKFVEVADKGVDVSDEDSVSVTSSIASGPSLLYNGASKKPRPSQGLCSACRKLYQKAKKMKAPIKNKLLDNDPKSLTCDQWVLIKTFRPRRPLIARGKLLIHVQLVKKRLKVKNGTKSSRKQSVGERESSTCSRSHTFLQRNLRVPVTKERKKNRRKRKRDDSQGPNAAKQQRLNSNSRLQHISVSCTDDLRPTSSPSSCPDFTGSSDKEICSPAEKDLTLELIPFTVTLDPPKQDAPKRGGFRDLLCQLRGNSSKIVRETR
ncbi:uncharacterized protein si:ch211-227n13.3 isoform X2 [Micropterus dolomieu]|uniref:uncharacterized protein si:ch211-227n13.3 isoform X2 n=1 Tax=Micropterus dolomieu TaxID=147949 RepID=UPI001E8CCF32|nr:uncharacterized protein si:ch211-227n13.3 isoform X2 [Micropterus dolomieu]